MASDHKAISRENAPTIRPLAMPRTYLLAPRMCGTFSIFGGLILSLLYIRLFDGVEFVLVVPLVCHIALILANFRDPQIDNVVQAHQGRQRLPRPRPSERRRYPGARSVLSGGVD